MSEHTPGPWRQCGGYGPHWTAIHSRDGYIVFSMADGMFDTEGANNTPIETPDEDTQRANARLIAAAPDLLAVCKSLVEHCDRRRGTARASLPLIELFLEAKAAIAKAEGKDGD